MTRCSQILLLLALLVACERPGDPARARRAAGQALQGTLAYPRSSALAVAAGSEAAQLTLTSPDSVATIVRWFQKALPLNGWTIQNVASGQGGEMTVYAQKAGRPLWITLRPTAGAPGTTYTMVGELPTDSTKH